MAHFSPEGYKNPASEAEALDPAFWASVGLNQDARFRQLDAGHTGASADAAKALQTANSYAGQIAQANTTAGEAKGIAQGAEGTADNAASRVDALEVMGGVQPGSVNDAEMKLHAEQDGGLFNTALKAQTVAAAERGGLFNILDYGATTGAPDNSAAMQAAADAALTGGGILYIPAGAWRIASPVDVAVSVRSDGEVLVSASSTGRINVVRTLTPVTTTVTGGLTAGSPTVTGLGGLMGDLYLSSTEHLIERNNGTTGQHYVKSEVSKIVSTAGAVSPPVKITYNSTSTVTATVYPTEPALNLGRLTITVDGTGTEGDDYAYLIILRSDVTVDDLTVINESATALTNAVVIRQATNIEFNRPTIHGFKKAGTGYGIARYNTADFRINDARITGCRHAVSGLWNKDTTIDRGTSEGGLDDHWAWGFYVNQHNSTVGASGTHVLAAGADVVATGGTFTGGRNVMGIRVDTPELAGEFLLKGDWSWTPSDGETSRWVMGYSSRNVAAFNYGRALRSPARAEVSGGTLNIPSGAITYIVQSAGAAFSHDQWGLITVGRVATTPGSIVTAAYADRDPSVHSGGPVRIDVDRMDFTGIGDNILVIDTGDSGTGSLGTVAIRDCTGVHLKLPERGMSSITVDRTEVRRVFRSAASAAPADIGLTFRDSTMQAVNFNGTHWADFSRCTWRGASSATALSMDLRVKSYLSNLHANGATGHPTHPDGYRNTTYYKAA